MKHKATVRHLPTAYSKEGSYIEILEFGTIYDWYVALANIVDQSACIHVKV